MRWSVDKFRAWVRGSDADCARFPYPELIEQLFRDHTVTCDLPGLAVANEDLLIRNSASPGPKKRHLILLDAAHLEDQLTSSDDLLIWDRTGLTSVPSFSCSRIAADWVFASRFPETTATVQRTLLEKSDVFGRFAHQEWTHEVRRGEIASICRHLSPGMAVLEIGSGNGFSARTLMDSGFTVTATDPSPRFPQFVPVKPTEGSNLPFDDAQFDMIVSLHVLEHIQDIGFALREMRRVLKSNGEAVHIMPAPPAMAATILLQPPAYFRNLGRVLKGQFPGSGQSAGWRKWLRQLVFVARSANPYRLFWGGGHGIWSRRQALRMWSEDAWRGILQSNGFVVKAVEPLPMSGSLHKLFPFRFMKLRTYLGARGFAISKMYVLRRAN